MKLHEICRKKRRDINMTQVELAHLTEIDQGAISRFEKGQGKISTRKLDRIFEALNIDLDKLI